jgi:hypothetical protein
MAVVSHSYVGENEWGNKECGCLVCTTPYLECARLDNTECETRSKTGVLHLRDVTDLAFQRAGTGANGQSSARVFAGGATTGLG